MASILVIDEHKQIQGWVRQILEPAGYVVEEASSRHEALRRFRQAPADLVILSFVLSENKGLATLRDLRLDYPKVKAIAISAGRKERESLALLVARLMGVQHLLEQPSASPVHDGCQCAE